MDVVAYLASKGYHGRAAAGSEITYPCFFDCNEGPDSRKRKLYVNGESGLYSCKVCVSEGNHVQLMRHFGDEPEKDDRPEAGRRSEVLECATRKGEEMLAANEDVVDYLLGPRRMLAPETIVERRLGYAPAQWPLTRQLIALDRKFSNEDFSSAGLLTESGREFFLDRILIPYIEDGRVVQVRGKDIFGRYYTCTGDKARLYNVDSLKGATEAVVVEGEFDTAILAEHLAKSSNERVRRLAVVGLPGVNTIPDDFLAKLSGCKRVFVATDPDEAGQAGGQKIATKIGDRAVVVAWPKALLTSWTEAGRELKDLDWTTWIGKLGASVTEVEALFKIPGRLKTVMQALLGHRARPTKGLQLGYKHLDAIFQPGLLPGQVAVFLAKTGVGKTLLLCNLAYNLREKRVLFITLEMTAEEIWTRLARIYRFYHPYASDESIAEAYSRLRICDANRLDETAFRALVEEYTEDVGEKPEICFVDYLGYYARGFRGGSQYEKTTDAIMQLKAEAKTYEFVIVTPAQVNRGAIAGKPIDLDDARDSGAIEETADLLVGVWRSDDALATDSAALPNGKLHFKILKSRHGGVDRVFQTQMGLLSLVIVDDVSKFADRANREALAVFKGQTYDQHLAEIRNRDRHLQEN